MRDTLVLNASFEPLSTVTLNRAVVLVPLQLGGAQQLLRRNVWRLLAKLRVGGGREGQAGRRQALPRAARGQAQPCEQARESAEKDT